MSKKYFGNHNRKMKPCGPTRLLTPRLLGSEAEFASRISALTFEHRKHLGHKARLGTWMKLVKFCLLVREISCLYVVEGRELKETAVQLEFWPSHMLVLRQGYCHRVFWTLSNDLFLSCASLGLFWDDLRKYRTERVDLVGKRNNWRRVFRIWFTDIKYKNFITFSGYKF